MIRTFALPVVLDPAQVVEDRSFTHPDHVDGDRAVLSMLSRDVAQRAAATHHPARPIVSFVPNARDWYRRVIVPHPADLPGPGTITVVGFFGRLRDVVDPEVARTIKEMSDQLAEAVVVTPGILGYSTHLLADERNYANLVMVESPEVITQWRTTAPHPAAAGDLSPSYYAHVRIYRGSVDRSRLERAGAVQLDSVKYWDYRCDPVWQAVRTLA